MENGKYVTAALIVAHPDDETIWAGGTVLIHSDWHWTIVSLCRGSDTDRAPKFIRVVQQLGGVGEIGDLDDETEQVPLSEDDVQQMVLSLLPEKHFDIILTHSPHGEYTRHRRHEEIGAAVASLWENELIKAKELWMFAYEDGGKGGKDDLPKAIKTAHLISNLPEDIWRRKYLIVTDTYGFAPGTYEADIVMREEAFWCFQSPVKFRQWLKTERRKR
ncbi:MAG: PIG-L family deacetylase [Candidatus Thorarchaeota archaeon]|nr:PIG-L family deacetylase [Candidatus Thorarchaeota archaeon]